MYADFKYHSLVVSQTLIFTKCTLERIPEIYILAIAQPGKLLSIKPHFLGLLFVQESWNLPHGQQKLRIHSLQRLSNRIPDAIIVPICISLRFTPAILASILLQEP